MDRVFRGLAAGAVSPDGDVVEILLDDGGETKGRILMTAEAAPVIAHHLVTLAAMAETKSQRGMPADTAEGSLMRARSVPVVEIGVDRVKDQERIVLQLLTEGGGQYSFSMPDELGHQLRLRLPQI